MIVYLAQIIIASLLIVTILLQSRGSGLGGAFGGSGGSYHSKRGLEIVLFRATIILAVLFAFTSLLALT